MAEAKRVYMYTYDIPQPTGNGFRIRNYTNARAYLDLGYKVEIVVILKASKGVNWKSRKTTVKIAGLDVVLSTVEISLGSVPFVYRLAYRMGMPVGAVLDAMYPLRRFIQQEVRRREVATPGAIHHFESLGMASAVVGLQGITCIWSCHDSVSMKSINVAKIRDEIDREQAQQERNRKIRRLRKAEFTVARNANLVLTISKQETKMFRRMWGLQHIHLLPMSWPDETPVPRRRTWLEDGRLRLLHLGSVDAFIGYTSLRFLLKDVFPLLPRKVLDRLELLVVGSIGGTKYSQNIQALARPYRQVHFLGYVNDVRPYYSTSDLQVVGSPMATGLRTRIIESLAYGVPVLSTSAAAAGAIGLRSGKNVLLADDAQEFADHLLQLVEDPKTLARLAVAGRKTYERLYSRQVAADCLAKLLKQHVLLER